jgi:hypothetical protein
MKNQNLIEKMLNPKSIVYHAIKSKLEGTGVTSMIFIYYLETDKFNLMVQNAANENMKIDIDSNDINLLKKMYLSRLVSKWKELNPNDEPKNIIIQFDVKNESFELFIETKKCDVLKFEY